MTAQRTKSGTLSSILVFQSAFVPGWTFNEFPAFANTRTLAATLFGHTLNFISDKIKPTFTYGL